MGAGGDRDSGKSVVCVLFPAQFWATVNLLGDLRGDGWVADGDGD